MRQALARQAGQIRWLYSRSVACELRRYEAKEKLPEYTCRWAALTILRKHPECLWPAEGGVVAQQRALTCALLVGTFYTQSGILVNIMTRPVKRQFPREFRAVIVKRVLDSGQSASQVARTHDLAPSLVAGWVRQSKVDLEVGPQDN